MFSSTVSIDDLRQAQAGLKRRPRFPPLLETEYRRSQNRRYRGPRTIFFAVVAAAFALSPFYSDFLFRPSPAIKPVLLWIQLGWMLPALLLSIGVTVARCSEMTARYTHTFTVLSLWCSLLLQHFFGLLGEMQFPSHLLAISAMGVAVFGGFRVRRFVAGVSSVMLVEMLLVFYLVGDTVQIAHAVYEQTFSWLIAIAGATSLDLLGRHAWINRQITKALGRTDGITGLLTRRAFDEIYARVIQQAVRDGRAVGVALIDLDHFKSINDRYGHAKGDEVLGLVGMAVRNATARRGFDLQGRYGGEELIVLWYDIDASMLDPLTLRIEHAVRDLRYRSERSAESLSVTASIGAVWAQPSSVADGLMLIERADALLYEAKAAGRNCRRLEALPARGSADDRQRTTA